MTEEQIARKKEYAGEKKTSMKRRDDNHDYTERRMYMITLEVEGRRPLFGRIVGDVQAEQGSKDEPRMELSELGKAVENDWMGIRFQRPCPVRLVPCELGKAVENEWMGIHGHYPQIEVMAVQMMPDHMHGILFVRDRLPVHLGQVISGFKAGCRKAERALRAAAQPQLTEKTQPLLTGKTKPLPTEKAEPSSQQVTALPSQESYHPLFAKGYNDLILRSYDELPVWQNYLRDNPRRLLMKRSHPEWLRPFFNLQIGKHSYSGIGNRELLKATKRKAVRVSRRLTEAQIVAEVEQCLKEARDGCVLVSPAISPGEKRVMRAAFNAGLPTIVIMENGFTPLSKPHGEQFYGCAKGLLLMLSPWEHHNEKRRLTAQQCTEMNLMALEIAGL